MAIKKFLVTIDTKEHADSFFKYTICKDCKFVNNCTDGDYVCDVIREIGIEINNTESISKFDIEDVTE